MQRWPASGPSQTRAIEPRHRPPGQQIILAHCELESCCCRSNFTTVGTAKSSFLYTAAKNESTFELYLLIYRSLHIRVCDKLSMLLLCKIFDYRSIQTCRPFVLERLLQVFCDGEFLQLPHSCFQMQRFVALLHSSVLFCSYAFGTLSPEQNKVTNGCAHENHIHESSARRHLCVCACPPWTQRVLASSTGLFSNQCALVS